MNDMLTITPASTRSDRGRTEWTSLRRTNTGRAGAVTHLSIGNVTTPIARPLPRRLLGVWAHPDDECYLSAGLMARVVGAGGDVRLVCATRGEHGTDDPAVAGTERFADLRQAELVASLATLGVDDLHLLGIADGACDEQPDDVMAVVIASHVDAFRPDAIVTFGPDGITGHADHRAVSRWTTAAVATADDAPELLYATLTDDFVRRHQPMHDELGLFGMLSEGRPSSVARRHVALQCTLDHGELIRKRRALAEHGSQTDMLAALVTEPVYFRWWQDECFRSPTPAEWTSGVRPQLSATVGV